MVFELGSKSVGLQSARIAGADILDLFLPSVTGSASSPNGCGVAKFSTDTLFPTLVNGQVEDLEYTLGQLLSPARATHSSASGTHLRGFANGRMTTEMD